MESSSTKEFIILTRALVCIRIHYVYQLVMKLCSLKHETVQQKGGGIFFLHLYHSTPQKAQSGRQVPV